MRRRFLEAPLWPGLVGGLAAAAISLLLQSERDTVILPEITTDAATSIFGARGFSFLLGELGSDGKPLLFLGVLIVQVAVYASLWMNATPPLRRWWGERRREAGIAVDAVALILASASIFLVASAILIAATDAELPSRTSWGAYTLSLLAASAAFALVTAVLAALAPQPSDARPSDVQPAQPQPLDVPADPSRRRFLRSAGGLAVGAVATVFIGNQVVGRRGSGVQRSNTGMPTPEITPTDDFYIVSKNLFDPSVNGKRWRLRVGGAAQGRLELALADLPRIPAGEEFVTMQCISNRVGGDLIGNALWKGFPLRTLLEQVEPLPSANFVAFRSVDDYTESLPLDFALQDQVMLVYEMNGEPLPFKHGFPLRLLAPGKYGIKHPKWLTEIALVEEEFFGFWQQRGWSQEARMKTSSRIDVPAPGQTVDEGSLRIYGVAFSGDRGIQRVEVSTDRGFTWNEAVLRLPLAPLTWVVWHYDTTVVSDNGRFNVMARATDGTGEVQAFKPTRPDPDGAAGWPAVSVRVREGPVPIDEASG
ncbi:MAG: molybdopterin-dependent oxidoreductase [Dehalococcoidia bacterium]